MGLDDDDRLRVIGEVTRAFAEASFDPQRLLDTIASRLAEVIGDASSLLLLSDDGTTLEPVAQADRDPEVLALARAIQRVPVVLDQHPVMRRVHDTAEAFVAALTPAQLQPPHTSELYAAYAARIGLHAILIAPLRSRGRVIGQLTMMRHRATPGAYTPADVALIMMFADNAALAIDNTRAYAAERAARIAAQEAREALSRSRHEHRHFFESSPIPMYAYDTQTLQFVTANDAAFALYGYTREEFLALGLADLRVPDSLPRLADIRAAGERVLHANTRHRRKDGTVIDVEGTSHVSMFDGKPARFVMLSDITARATAIRERRRAESRFDRLATAGIIGVLVTDLDGQIHEVNETARELFGYAREELLAPGFRWANLVSPEWQAEHRAKLELLRGGAVARPREREYVRKDGRRIAVLTGAALLEGGDEVISVVLDLTGQQWADAAIEHLREARTSEAKIRGLLEAAPDGIVITDRAGAITLVNARTEQLFGQPRAQLLGGSVASLIAADSRTQHARTLLEHVTDDDGPASALELLGVRDGGSSFPIELNLSPIATEDGKLVVISIRDVSDRKAIEVALQVANRELEAFSYSVAHDLRAPLRGMNGFASLIAETYADKLDDEGREWLGEIRKNAAKMGALIDALLSLSRLSRSELYVDAIDLAALAREAFGELAAAEPARTVELVIAAPIIAHADRALARSLLANLVANAWKFTRDEPRAQITLGELTTASGRTFFVRDNGAGFDMTYADKLFVPFQRLHSVSQFPGTGIGLATVQRIVHRHGGRAWADGEVGRGATFYFTLAAGR